MAYMPTNQVGGGNHAAINPAPAPATVPGVQQPQVGGGQPYPVNANHLMAPGVGAVPGMAPGTPPQAQQPMPGMPGMPGMPPKTDAGQNPNSPWAPVPGAGVPPPMVGTGPGGPKLPGLPGAPQLGGYASGGQYAGVSTVNPQAEAADYASVNQFADQAYEQSRRYLDPQQKQENQRFQQTLINQGIDPNSEAGRQAADQLARTQNDANSKAAFDALGFGQGMQQQMFGQDLARSGLAGQMQLGDWQNTSAMNNALANLYGTGVSGAVGMGGNLASIYGADKGYEASVNNANTQRYLGKLNHQLGMGNLDLNRQKQDWNQYSDLEGMNQWEAIFNRQGDWRNQDLMLEMIGQTPIGGGGNNSAINPGQAGNPMEPWSDWAGKNWSKFGPDGGGG